MLFKRPVFLWKYISVLESPTQELMKHDQKTEISFIVRFRNKLHFQKINVQN